MRLNQQVLDDIRENPGARIDEIKARLGIKNAQHLSHALRALRADGSIIGEQSKTEDGTPQVRYSVAS